MFSGIVEEMAEVVAIKKYGENVDFTFRCSFINELKIDQSVAHNGVCLTVVAINDPEPDTYVVTAMKETLDRSNLGLLEVGSRVNVERSTFTLLPTCNSPRLERSSVSFIAVTT